MIFSPVVRLLLSNTVTFINLLLLIFTNLLKEKQAMLKMNNISGGLMTIVYLFSGCYTSAIANIFSLGRNMYCEKSTGQNKVIIVLIILAGTALTLAFNLKEGEEQLAIIPVISFLFYSVGIFVSKSANQMKIVSAIDVLLWIAYDYKNMLIICVLQDIFIVLTACFSNYIQLFKDDDGAENDPSEKIIRE